MGMTFVRNDGTQFHFCTSKCRKSFNMKRNPRRVKHTQLYREQQGKVLHDKAFQIEKRHNRPIRYNRELWQKTQGLIDRLMQIQIAREQRAALDRKRQHAIRVLSSQRAKEMGFSTDLNDKMPDLSKYDKTKIRSNYKISYKAYKKLDLKYAQEVMGKQKLQEKLLNNQ